MRVVFCEVQVRHRVLLVVLGIGLVANPFYLWPHYSDPSAEQLRANPIEEPDVANHSGPVVHVEDLPPETAAAFESALDAADERVAVRDRYRLRQRTLSETDRWPVFERGETPLEGLPDIDDNAPFMVGPEPNQWEYLYVTDGSGYYYVGIVYGERLR